MAWKAGIGGILDHPIFGWGPEHYRNAFDLHAPARLFRGPTAENWFDRAHNIILDIGTTTGFLGLAAYLGFYAAIFACLLGRWRRNGNVSDSLTIAGLLTAYLVQNLFSFDTVNTDGVVFMVAGICGLALRQIRCDSGGSRGNPDSAQSAISWRGWLGLAALAGILVCGYCYTVKRPADSNRLLMRAEDDGKGRAARLARLPATSIAKAAVEDFRRPTSMRQQAIPGERRVCQLCNRLAGGRQVPAGERAQVAKRA